LTCLQVVLTLAQHTARLIEEKLALLQEEAVHAAPAAFTPSGEWWCGLGV
jgi:hypothetical protein